MFKFLHFPSAGRAAWGALIVLAIIARLAPHPFNVTPLGGLGLFAGAYCDRRVAWLVPLVALLIGDSIGGFYDPVVLVFVYVGMLAGPLFGRLFLSAKRSTLRFVGAVGCSSGAFFILSNFGVWAAGMYPPTLAGLVECYVMGLPFLVNTVFGNFLFGAIFFGTYAGAQHFIAIRRAKSDPRARTHGPSPVNG